MNPTFRLITAALPGVIALSPALLFSSMYLLLGLNGCPVYLLAFALMFLFFLGMSRVFKRFFEGDLARELKERKGKPIKVLKLGKWNVRFLDKLGFYYTQGEYFPVLVNPKPGRYTIVKHLYMPAVSSKTLSDELLEIAAINQPAYEEICSKIERRKWTTKFDAQYAETADMVAKSITDILT